MPGEDLFGERCSGTLGPDTSPGASSIQNVENKKEMRLRFQVADVKKTFDLGKRIVEKGNLVSFGPEGTDNFIKNKMPEDRIPLVPNGSGSYLMKVNFLGGKSTDMDGKFIHHRP